MRDLLYLVHRIPFPPRKGDKLRSYHFLRHLCRHYRVHLATFVDDPADLEHIPTVERMCASACIERLRPRIARARSLGALATRQPLTLPYFGSARLRHWVDAHARSRQIHRVLVFSSSMAQYAMGMIGRGIRGVVDFVDVDSEKWSSYAQAHRGPARHLFRREGVRLLEFEREVARQFDASVFVTEQEADLFRHRAPESASRVTWIPNGVDTSYFDPAHSFADPFEGRSSVLVFTGAMDYRPNVEAVSWFVDQVLPRVQAKRPEVRFFIVGANPVPSVRALAARDGVEVTGTVEDVRPYVAHAALAVAPLRVARGVQNKVLEAMAMGRPVVATTAAMEGIDAEHGLGDQVTDEPEQMAERIDTLLGDPRRRRSLGAVARQFIERGYDWSVSAGRLIDLIESRPESG